MEGIIINADDLGQSEGINRGIREAREVGVVNSCSLMVNGHALEEGVELVKTHNWDRIGLHVVLTEGKPILSTHKTIVDSEGLLLRDLHQRTDWDANEIISELEAQLRKALEAGVHITHLDSHHHIHMIASLRSVFIAFSKMHNLPLRRIPNASRNPLKRLRFIRTMKDVPFYTRYFSAGFYGESATEENLRAVLKKHKGRNLEIMCHPGYADPYNGIYNTERENELKILTSDSIRQLLSDS